MRLSPPLGIIRSIYSSNFSISSTASLSVVGISWIAASGIPSFAPASFKILQMAIFEFIASEPPRNITAFPDFMQSPAASAVTFGLDS